MTSGFSLCSPFHNAIFQCVEFNLRLPFPMRWQNYCLQPQILSFEKKERQFLFFNAIHKSPRTSFCQFNLSYLCIIKPLSSEGVWNILTAQIEGHVLTFRAKVWSRPLLFFFLGPHPWHMEVPRLGVKSELQLPAYATATTTLGLSHVCYLHHSSWQPWILNLLIEARD